MITGAAGNLGSAVAQAFAAQGASLALLDREPERLQQLLAQLGSAVTGAGFATDLLEQTSVDASVTAILQRFGRIDVLANIAGGFTMGPRLHETSDRDWDLMMNLNARSILHTCRAVLPQMLQGGTGRVINVAARAAREGKAKMGPYCASKAAVITLTETLAAEHKLDGINVNCILPGTIDTPQNRRDMPDADHSRWVPPAALADVVLFLAADASRAVTGAAIPVYGQS
jgi:NAD(P)-dependent dehydrogenase (short-subunit alcohol dehydrogenase family)